VLLTEGVAVRHAIWVVLLTSSLAVGATAANGPQEFQVVVHPSVKGTWISRTSLQAVFTGKTDRWGDKTSARPVDQSAKSPVRHAFTVAVLGVSMGEIQRYWQERVATQRLFPPPIKSNDEEVLRYVAANPGAVGYVAAEIAIPESVRVVSVVD
jgi:ABC-type phosphate transport system substrate-binding protein